MELWIRSQDREILVKVNNIEKQDHYAYKEVAENYMPPNATRYEDMRTRKVSKKDKYIKSVIMCNDEIFLGEYKTKERALEILDEIQRRLTLSNYETTNNKYSQYDKLVESKTSKESSAYVYEMPKE